MRANYSADMSDNHSDKVWDEYDWERFLQEQEVRTEKYMELLEKYIDDPRRDEIIAREMQWTHLSDGEAREWEEEVDAQFHEEMASMEEDMDAEEHEEVSVSGFEKNPIYQKALSFSVELTDLLNGLPSSVIEHPAAVMLHCHATMTAAKLAAALNDDDVEELGMSIAYLKRALFMANNCLNSLAQLWDGEMMEADRHEAIRGRIFEIRDGIVETMGDYRAEFRKQHGG